MSESILGISAYYHDSAAALVVDGEIVAAAQEERFTRKKNDDQFPKNAIKFLLEESGLTLSDIDAVAFYDKPYLKFERLLETAHSFAPAGLKFFLAGIPIWAKEKLFTRQNLKKEFKAIGGHVPPLLFPEHHLSHAASAFFASPFETAAIMTLDGVGEWATTTIGSGDGNRIELAREIDFPHSLGLIYSAFTSYCGFKVNSGEYKLMGLAPYGDESGENVRRFKQKIYDHLLDVRSDGSFLLNMDHFAFATSLKMYRGHQWEKLFGVAPRKPETTLSQDHMDLALSIQQVLEETVFKLARTARELTGQKNLVMAGGVALNCVVNGKLLRSGIFDDIWIQPASGDAGGALGAALAGWHIWMEKPRIPKKPDLMKGSLLGPEFNKGQIEETLRKRNAVSRRFDDYEALCAEVARLLADGNIVGWFQGKMEYGPRALGNRCILADARNPEMQKKLNLKIKFREEFRPFAPSVIEEDCQIYFEFDRPSPYMLFVAPVQKEHRLPTWNDKVEGSLLERLYQQRSDIPAITHIDCSSRLQTVSKETNPRFHALLSAFRELTGYGLLVNTSFNVRGEPIVRTPEDAWNCFMKTDIDYLVIDNELLAKGDQAAE